MENSVSKFIRYVGDKHIISIIEQYNNNRNTPQELFFKMPSGFLFWSSLFLIIKCHFYQEEASYLICAYFSFNLSAGLHNTNNYLSSQKKVNKSEFCLQQPFKVLWYKINSESLCSWLFLAHNKAGVSKLQPLYQIQPAPIFINTILFWNTVTSIHFYIVYGCFF